MKPRFRFVALPALVAVVCALAAACQAPLQPEGDRSTPAPPLGSTEPAAIEDVPAVLPTPMVDSELAPEDQTAIESLLDSDALEAYLPADLINDGGVILYQTLAAGDRDRDRGANPVKTAEAGPADWKRQNIQRGGRQLVLRHTPGVGVMSRRATVVVRVPMLGAFAYRDAERGTRGQKRFMQIFERTLRFGLEQDQWKLVELSPIEVKTRGASGEDSPVKLAGLSVFAAGQETPAIALSTFDRFIAPEEVPVLQAGSSVRLEASLAAGADVYVFAHLTGAADRSRQALVDDGTHGDRVAGDGIYTGTFAVPMAPGVRHFGVDVIDSSSFKAGGVYRSHAIGTTFRVEAAD